jgi:ferritin-like metal-binding protein YciE
VPDGPAHLKTEEGEPMKLETLRELFITDLQDLYSAENMIIKALPKVIEKASAPDLKSALNAHLQETKAHVGRLDQIFDQLGDDVDRKDKKCKGMEGVLKENKELLGEDAEPEVLDAGIIAGAQKVEHYEIASYGTVRTYANLLGRQDWVQLLEVTLEEEKEADRKLSQLSNHINIEAKAA